MPAKLAAGPGVRHRQGRKTDAHDAHAIVMVALRTQGLRELTVDEGLTVLRLLADRRDELSRSRAQILNRLQRPVGRARPGWREAGAVLVQGPRPSRDRAAT